MFGRFKQIDSYYRVHDRLLAGEYPGGWYAKSRRTKLRRLLDAALADGHTVYVHCYAGLGRTGTVVGCYLVRHGQSGQQALDELVRLRRGTALEGAFSPITDEQRRLVYEWGALNKPRSTDS